MIAIWIDAQISPVIATWIDQNYEEIGAKPVRDVGLRDAEDEEIFEAAREADVIVMSKDSDFTELLERNGPPPKVIWLTCGNTSNQKLRKILRRMLRPVVKILEGSEAIVEIGNI